MSITLGSLRTFCQEVASKDSTGTTAEREFMHWINNALEKLYLETSLDATRRETKIYVPPSVTRTDGVTTQGSLVVTSATAFLDVWRSERWGIHIEGDDQTEYEIATLNGPLTDATMRTGDNWVLASATGLDVTAAKNKFLIPTVAEILSVRYGQGREVPYSSPEDFDRLKGYSPTHRNDTPQVCTYRNDYLEIYPAPSDGYYHLAVTYRLGFTPHSSAAVADGGDADATLVSWPDRFLGILKKGILVEAALSQGKSAPVPYPLALAEFNLILGQLRANSQKEMTPGPLSILPPILPRRRGRYSLPPGGTLEDVGP